MTHNNMIVIDKSTGEVLHNMKPAPINPPQAPKLPAAFNQGKSGQQLLALLDAFTRPWQYQLNVYLGINEYGTKYCHIKNKFLFESFAREVID